MYYLSEDLIINAINEITSIQYQGSPYKNEKDLLSYFLFLSKLKINKFQPKTLTEIFGNQENSIQILYELSGIFSPNEKVDKKGSLFFTTFYHSNEYLDSKSFYNKGTTFNRLHGRLKDTIDNSIADYLLQPKIVNKERYYTFINNIENIIIRNYSNKFLLSSILIWIYRFREFETEVSYEDLLNLFMSEYNLSDEQINMLFQYNKRNLLFQETFIQGIKIREHLHLNEYTEILTNTNNTNFIQIKTTKKSDLEKIIGVKMDKDTLLPLIKKYKQIILTGVPGTGKSHIIEELSTDFTLKKVQFHQNYTYQEFILGKTIHDGNVEYEKGVFLSFLLDEVNANPNQDFLFIIDEINRGNTSAIFGELLHALDRDKPIELSNGDILTLPDNLYIIGSMNSADRSIALVDYAIRRRFLFIELEPNYALLDSISKLNNEIILGSFLLKINNKIETILKNRDFRLGHSYFIKTDTENFSKEDIYEILNYKIIPILYEYAQGDSNLINKILSINLIQATNENILEAISDYLDDE